MTPFRYIVTVGGEGREMYPSGVRDMEETYVLNEEDRRFAFVAELNVNLTFSGDDFQFLYALEVNKCRQLPLTIERYCGGGYITWRDCTLRLIDGTWNLDDCTVTIKPRLKNEYTCFEEKAGNEVNLLSLPPAPVTVSHLQGTIEKMMYTSETEALDDPAHFGGTAPAELKWKAYIITQELKSEHQKIKEIILGPLPQQPVYTYFYAREVVSAATSPGEEWVNIGSGKWARFPLLIADYNDYSEAPPEGPYQVQYLMRNLIFGDRIGVGAGSFDNGRRLNDLFTYFAQDTCGLVVKSIFFGINGDADFADTYPDFDAEASAGNIVFQKSDIKRADDLNNATIAPYSFQKLLKNICNIYNLQWRIEAGAFRIEHVSYFKRDQTLDLTIEPRKTEVVRTRKYTYNTDSLPHYEVFKFMEAGGTDFAGVPIEYTGGCVTFKKEQQEKTVTIESITTDLLYCMQNSDSESSKVSDEGLFLMATKQVGDTYTILSTAPTLDTEKQLNNVLGWPYLHKTYFLHERLQLAGYINKTYTQFKTVKPIKKRDKLSIKFCCTDTVNLTGTVNTDMGIAFIGGAAYKGYDSDLELQLVYPDLTPPAVPCLAPVAFSVDSHTGSTWVITTNFAEAGLYTTITEITYPDGHTVEVIKEADESGSFTYSYDTPAAGTYKLRKRIVSEDGDCPWTDYVTDVPVVNPPPANPCEFALPLPQYMSRNGFILTFRFNNYLLDEDIEAEIMVPNGTSFAYITGMKTAVQENTFLHVNISAAFTAEQRAAYTVQGPPYGRYDFKFRRICNRDFNDFSPWSELLNVNLP